MRHFQFWMTTTHRIIMSLQTRCQDLSDIIYGICQETHWSLHEVALRSQVPVNVIRGILGLQRQNIIELDMNDEQRIRDLRQVVHVPKSVRNNNAKFVTTNRCR